MTDGNRPKSRISRCAGVIVCLLLLQIACHPGKQTVSIPSMPPAPIRIAFLPPNIPESTKDLEWVSLAIPILMAEITGDAADLDVVPLWESMPLALELAGPSHEIDPEMAAKIAARLSAKWATQGNLSSTRSGISLTEDFIPARRDSVAFRYGKILKVASIEQSLIEAVSQFLRYQRASPLVRKKGIAFHTDYLRTIAETVDREYGWFSAAQPAKAGQLVATLSSSNNRVARLLFNPAIYPEIGPDPVLSASQSGSSKTQPEPSETNNVRPSLPSLSEAADVSGLPPNKAQSLGTLKGELPKQPSSETRRPTEAPEALAQVQPGADKKEAGVAPSDRIGVGSVNAKPVKPLPSPAAPTSGAGPKISVPKSNADQTITPSITSEKMTAPTPADYVIQLFSSQNRRSTEAEAARLQKKSLAVRIEEEDLKERGTWYRIRLHGYRSPAAAESAAAKLQAEGLIKEYWIALQIDYIIQVFSSHHRRNAEAEAARLEKAGLAVEIEKEELSEKGIWFRVRLHGYSSPSEAKSAAEKLLTKGIIQEYWITY